MLWYCVRGRPFANYRTPSTQCEFEFGVQLAKFRRSKSHRIRSGGSISPNEKFESGRGSPANRKPLWRVSDNGDGDDGDGDGDNDAGNDDAMGGT